MQNVPKRDKEAQQITRRCFVPKNGYLWFEVDYSGIEVHIAATYHKDPNMIAYLNDPSSDMHRDAAAKLFKLPPDRVTKDLRQGGKNGFVFPQFYGDYWGNNAPFLWAEWVCHPSNGLLADGTHVKQWLARKGIKNLDQFAKHVKKVESWLWNEQFPVYNQWREDHWQQYQQDGFFRGHTGFIYSAIMNRNDAINYGTQGSAFHCLLRSMTNVNRRLKDEQWMSFLIGQIHDSIDGNAHPSEINELLPMIKSIMVDDLMQDFEWINVPMEVEFELSPLGGSWADLKEVNKRTHTCACGLEWGYKKKEQDGSIRWSCPVCEHFDVERKVV